MSEDKAGPADAAAGSPEAGDADAGPHAGETGLAAESLSLLDAVFDYFSARLHLEGYRLEARGRSILVRVIATLVGSAVALSGLALLGFGVSILIGEALGSRAAGLIIVGAVYLLAGVITAGVAARRRS